MNATRDIDYGELYFGDDAAQAAAISSLSSGLREKPGAHIVLGGKRSGKSTVIEETIDGFFADSSFISMTLSNTHAYFNTNELGELKNALLALTEKTGIDDDFQLFESNSDRPHEILFIAEELDLPRHAQQLRSVMNALRNLPPSVGPLSIVFDSPNDREPLLHGVVPLAKKQDHEVNGQCISGLLSDHPELAIHKTAYSHAQVKEALWAVRDEGVSVTRIRQCLEHFNVDIKHPAIMDMSKALKEKDRTKYDLAFERIPLAEVRR